MTVLTTQDLRDIQDSNDVVTPRQVVEILQKSGRDVTSRSMSFLQTQDVLPAVDRVGPRGGQLPAITIDLIVFIVDLRARGLRLGAIRELIPLWACLIRGQIRGNVDLAEFEQVARSRSLSDDAALNVPALVEHVLAGLNEQRVGGTNVTLKDGSTIEAEDTLVVKFVFASVDHETGSLRLNGWSQLAIPGLHQRPDLTDPSVVLLGVPPTFELEAAPPLLVQATRPARRQLRKPKQIEELPLNIA